VNNVGGREREWTGVSEKQRKTRIGEGNTNSDRH